MLAGADRTDPALLHPLRVADRLFERRRDLIVPNFLGALLLVLAGCGALGLLAAALLFPAKATCCGC